MKRQYSGVIEIRGHRKAVFTAGSIGNVLAWIEKQRLVYYPFLRPGMDWQIYTEVESTPDPKKKDFNVQRAHDLSEQEKTVNKYLTDKNQES